MQLNVAVRVTLGKKLVLSCSPEHYVCSRSLCLKAKLSCSVEAFHNRALSTAHPPFYYCFIFLF